MTMNKEDRQAREQQAVTKLEKVIPKLSEEKKRLLCCDCIDRWLHTLPEIHIVRLKKALAFVRKHAKRGLPRSARKEVLDELWESSFISDLVDAAVLCCSLIMEENDVYPVLEYCEDEAMHSEFQKTIKKIPPRERTVADRDKAWEAGYVARLFEREWQLEHALEMLRGRDDPKH